MVRHLYHQYGLFGFSAASLAYMRYFVLKQYLEEKEREAMAEFRINTAHKTSVSQFRRLGHFLAFFRIPLN